MHEVRERHLLLVRERNAADVRQPVLAVVPATVRQVDPANEGHRLVNDDDLLVVRPQVDGGGDVVRMTHHLSHKTHETQHRKVQTRRI